MGLSEPGFWDVWDWWEKRFLKHLIIKSSSWRIMLKNYLKTARRNLFKSRLFSLINIFGLALGIYVCMMVMVQVKDELSYDLFHPYPDRTYRIISDIIENKNDKQYKLASTPLPLKSYLSQRTDIIEEAVQLYPALKGKALNGDKELYINGAFTDPSFFKVFGFRLSAGNKKTALESTNGIVLSSETASRFFGKANAIGQTLSFGKMGIFQVTGVLEKNVENHILILMLMLRRQRYRNLKKQRLSRNFKIAGTR